MIFLFQARNEPAPMRIEADSFEEAESAVTNSLPRGHRLVEVDDDGDVTGFLMEESGPDRLSIVDARDYAIVPLNRQDH